MDTDQSNRFSSSSSHLLLCFLLLSLHLPVVLHPTSRPNKSDDFNCPLQTSFPFHMAEFPHSFLILCSPSLSLSCLSHPHFCSTPLLNFQAPFCLLSTYFFFGYIFWSSCSVFHLFLLSSNCLYKRITEQSLTTGFTTN